jgi:hypothetical protein
MKTIQLSSAVSSTVSSVFMGPDVAWYYDDATCNSNGGCLNLPNTKDAPQFCHFLFFDGKVLSSYFESAKQVLTEAEILLGKPLIHRLQRAKANLITQDGTYKKGQHHMPHIDSFDSGSESLIYYVNSTDAGTYFFDSDTQSITHTENSEAGKGVLFDSLQYHAGSSPVKQSRRVVLNFVFHPRIKE